MHVILYADPTLDETRTMQWHSGMGVLFACRSHRTDVSANILALVDSSHVYKMQCNSITQAFPPFHPSLPSLSSSSSLVLHPPPSHFSLSLLSSLPLSFPSLLFLSPSLRPPPSPYLPVPRMSIPISKYQCTE